VIPKATRKKLIKEFFFLKNMNRTSDNENAEDEQPLNGSHVIAGGLAVAGAAAAAAY
jgi:hypothetical protein